MGQETGAESNRGAQRIAPRIYALEHGRYRVLDQGRPVQEAREKSFPGQFVRSRKIGFIGVRGVRTHKIVSYLDIHYSHSAIRVRKRFGIQCNVGGPDA